MQPLLTSSESLLTEFHLKVSEAQSQFSDPLLGSEAAFKVCAEYLKKLKSLLRKFRNLPREQEIYFFKEIKPIVMSEYIYHALVYRLHYHWPMSSQKNQQYFLERILNKLGLFFDKYQKFYWYYRRNSSHRDNVYFVRWQRDPEPSFEYVFCHTDPSFNSPKDLLLSRIKACIKFQDYLRDQLQQISPSNFNYKSNSTSPLVWSESISAFVELVYALFLSNSVNNGKADIKTIIAVLGKALGIDPKYYYDSYRYIKMRKLDPVRYMDKLRFCLHQDISKDRNDTNASPQIEM
ncbi:MAG: RteC domain-containing protein [Chitinophagaceae bacterium]|nr:RteC domain-containing protein [Chitinophagaceae bacterium]